DPRVIELLPQAILQANSPYRIELKPEPGSRRTLGLFEHRIGFTTGAGTGPALEIRDVTPATLTVEGGELQVIMGHGSSPSFFLGGEIATVTRQDSLENGLVRYWLQAPALSPGVAELSVVENDGRRASR